MQMHDSISGSDQVNYGVQDRSGGLKMNEDEDEDEGEEEEEEEEERRR